MREFVLVGEDSRVGASGWLACVCVCVYYA